MTAAVRVVGDERALALAGVPGDAPSAPVVRLGEPGAEPADVVWVPGPGGAGGGRGARLIATGGEDLWSRAPWPVRDELFELGPPAEDCALVCGGDAGRRATVAEKLEARGRPVSAVPQITVDDLARASVVALLGDADAGTENAEAVARAMPAEAPAVLAARRVLVAPRCEVTFGLLPGSDHLAFGTDDDAVGYLDAVLSFPAAFQPFTVLGTLAAERHRASVVYARLAAELRSAPRSAAPRG